MISGNKQCKYYVFYSLLLLQTYRVCVKGHQNKAQTWKFYRAGTAPPPPPFEIPGSPPPFKWLQMKKSYCTQKLFEIMCLIIWLPVLCCLSVSLSVSPSVCKLFTFFTFTGPISTKLVQTILCEGNPIFFGFFFRVNSIEGNALFQWDIIKE